MLKLACALLPALLLLLFAPPLYAQQPTVEATVDRNQITTDEQVLLTVVIQGGQPDSPPVVPPLDGFRIVGTSSASQISTVNGVTTASFAYRYRLQPLQAGNFRIDPIGVTINGVDYQTNAITVSVEQGRNPLPEAQPDTVVPPSELTGQDFYVEADVDNREPYLGEQIVYIFRFFQAVELRGRPSYSPPSFVGFWNQQENQQTQTLTEVAGRTYRITSLVSPLFPTVDGSLTIEPARFTLPDGAVLLTQPVTVDVQALPPNATGNFSGAVGRYSLSAEFDKQQVAVGEPLTMRVVVSGVGNIDALPEPAWPDLAGWRRFESQQVVNTEFVNGVIQGSRLYEWLLTPSEEGDFVWPAIEYTYFNPESAQYETTASESFAVTVAGGADEVVTTFGEGEGVVNDIAAPKPAPARLSTTRVSIVQQPLYWLLWLIPAVVLVGDRLQHFRRSRSAILQVRRRRRRAFERAQQALAQARKNGDIAAEQILVNYLGDRFNDSFAGLNQQSRHALLSEHGVRESLARWVNRLYEQAESARYGYNGLNSGTLLDEVEQLIRQFERGEEHE